MHDFDEDGYLNGGDDDRPGCSRLTILSLIGGAVLIGALLYLVFG